MGGRGQGAGGVQGVGKEVEEQEKWNKTKTVLIYRSNVIQKTKNRSWKVTNNKRVSTKPLFMSMAKNFINAILIFYR